MSKFHKNESIFSRLKKASADSEWAFVRFFRLIAAEGYHALLNREEIPFRDRFRCWRHGFYGERAAFYDFEKYGYEAYVTDFERRIRTSRVNRAFADRLKGKGDMMNILQEAGAPVPKWFELDGEDKTNQLWSLLEREKRIIIKPRIGSGGYGVYDIEKRANQLFINQTVCNGFEVLPLESDWQAFEYVYQHEYAEKIFSKSTNSIRILTVRDVNTDKPFIAGALHRFGTDRSVPVDNFTRGGVVSAIDLENGILGPAISKPTFELPHWIDEHPNSGQIINGLQIPGWENVKKEVLTIADRLSDLMFGGWDVVITRDGSIKIIEVNLNSDVDLIQVHTPLLINDRTRLFYIKHGIRV